MLDSPLPLREYCLEYLRESINTSVTCCLKESQIINQTTDENNPNNNEPKNNPTINLNKPLISINGDITEELIESLSANNQLTDDVLLMPIFDSESTQLRRVRIPDASQLTTRGLRALKTHRINELEVCGLVKCTINELIGCLGEFSLIKLRSLNVARSSFTSSNKFCVVVGLAKLQSLQVLDVSHTEFNHHGLEIVVEDLPSLQCLNISATRVRDLTPLRKCKDRLRSLSMYNLRSTSGGCDEFVPILTELNLLKYLDISDDRDNPLDMLTPLQDCTTELLKQPQSFKHLISLDLSGKDGIDSQELKRFLTYKQQKNCESLKFLGLMQTTVCFEDLLLNDCHQWHDSDLIITGNATEAQIMESLRRYQERPTFVQKSLFHLYNYTLSYSEPRSDIIDMIVIPMRKHSKIIGIQMAATACLYNLTKNKFGEKIHPKTLKKVVDVTLLAMESFPNHQQLQKNALLTLCSDRILQDVSFDRYKCTHLVMDSLVAFKDTAMNRMAVAICSILAAKISTSETSSLGAKPVYMETLLDIVRSRVQFASDHDIMLKFTLSALWNLTDESPKTCEMFLEKGGMDLYLLVLNTFVGESAVETKVLGLLNNIAEVSYLRSNLMKLEFLTVLRNLMKSPQIDVSYFAAGIFAHLSSDGMKSWSCNLLDLKTVLDELVKVVLNWKTPEIEMVAYRSFLPFLPLLNCFESPAVQLWAIWAIHHVCSKNPKRYTEMLIEENGAKTIRNIYQTLEFNNNETLKTLCKQTLDVIKKEFPNFNY